MPKASWIFRSPREIPTLARDPHTLDELARLANAAAAFHLGPAGCPKCAGYVAVAAPAHDPVCQTCGTVFYNAPSASC